MILADTGPLVAAMDKKDPAHNVVSSFLARNREVIRVPSLVAAEVGYFVGHRLGAAVETAFAREIGEGALEIEDLSSADYLRVADLVEQYQDFPLGIVDASIVAVAERLGVTTVLTLDRRHFGAVQPRHCTAFNLVP